MITGKCINSYVNLTSTWNTILGENIIWPTLTTTPANIPHCTHAIAHPYFLRTDRCHQLRLRHVRFGGAASRSSRFLPRLQVTVCRRAERVPPYHAVRATAQCLCSIWYANAAGGPLRIDSEPGAAHNHPVCCAAWLHACNNPPSAATAGDNCIREAILRVH